jgi:subtilisin-like proprotein convertase family protein
MRTTARPMTRVLAALALVAMAGSLAVAHPAGAQQAPDPAPAADIPAEAADQIAAISADKDARTPAERKVASNLLYAAAEEAGGPAVAGAPELESTTEVDRGGRAEVDISAAVDADLLDRIEDLGGDVVASVPGFDAVRAVVPVEALVTLAADPGVRSIAEAGEVETHAGAGANEGVVTHGADIVQGSYGIDGTGVKVCVLSDGIDSLADRQATGDLPEVDVLPGQAGEGDEGTAMLELIHDMVPGAELGFATALDSQARFAQNIIDLRASGCDVTSDDVSYYTEGAFQDDDVARAISQVRAAGGIHFSSAGNSGNLEDGTSGTWQGDFQDVGASGAPLPTGLRVHGWGVGQTMNQLTKGSLRPVTLQWADPLGASTNDYDLYVLNTEGTAVLSASTSVQDGTQDPFEAVFAFSAEQLVVTKKAGAADRFLSLYSNRGELRYATGGATFGHNSSVDAVTTAATPVAGARKEGDPVGPFPGRHSAASESEAFSSDGPVRSFYAPDGTPLTPGVLTSAGGVVRNGPDLTAADGATTTTPGFETFFGTSAASPNAAALAALALSVDPTLTPDELEGAMKASAVDIEAPGVDTTTGSGIVMAPALMDEIGAEPGAFVDPGPRQIVEVFGDGDEASEPGEVFDITQPLQNPTGAAATDVTATLSSTSSDVVIDPAEATYGTIAPGATAAPSTAFRIRITRSCDCGAVLPFTVTATYGGGPAEPRTSDFSLVVGDGVQQPRSVAYAGPPVAIPDGDLDGVDTTIEVGDLQRIADLTLTIGGGPCSTAPSSTKVGLSHSYVGDVELALTSPEGTTVQLTVAQGLPGKNLCRTTFSDAATEPFAGTNDYDSPFTGAYRPVQPLGAFDGEDPEGTWTLTAVDPYMPDAGVLRAFSLGITSVRCDLSDQTPTAFPDVYATGFETPLTVDAPGVLGSDLDPEGEPLTAELLADVDHGTLVLDDDGGFTYTPDAGFSGADTFTYAAADETSTSGPATVTIEVAGATDDYVSALYRDFLDRQAQPGDLDYWGGRLAGGESRQRVAQLFARSREYAGLITRRAYVQYLGRPGDAPSVAYWAERIRTGLSVTELPVFLMGSQEFRTRAGGTDAGFVDAVYAAILGRAPPGAERSARLAELGRGTSRATVARTLHASIPSRRLRVRAQYQLLLDRQPTTAERDAGVRFLATGDDRLLAVSLAATDEYLAHASA